jgi:hypothetical protein
VVIVLVWLGIYGGMLLYKEIVEKKIAASNGEIAAKEKTIKEGGNKDIFDFQSRISLASTLLEKKNSALGSLDKLQEVMIGGVSVKSYDYNVEENALVIECEANNYNSAAKQILNFKKSEYFSEVSVFDISPMKGKIVFSIKTKINQKAK